MKSFYKFFFTSLTLIAIFGCRSMELTTAIVAVRDEHDLVRAEEWFKKALITEPENSLVPYLLAVEVYVPQKNWKEMAEMFKKAMEINPNQKLDNFFSMDGKLIQTVGQAVEIYRIQEWSKVYNSGVESYQSGSVETAVELFKVAAKILPEEGSTYGTLASLHNEQKDIDKAKEVLKTGLTFSPGNSTLLNVSGDINYNSGNINGAISNYKKALENTEDPGPILRKLIFSFIDMGEYVQAIEYSKKSIDQYPNDPDIYYNVGVLYQRMAIDLFEPARDIFLELSRQETPYPEQMRGISNDFQNSREYCREAKDYFLQASDLELEEDAGIKKAIDEMYKMIDQIDDIFLPAVEQMLK